MNVVRLMQDDWTSFNIEGRHYTGNSIAGMLINAGLAYKSGNVFWTTRDIRLKVLSVIAQPGAQVELGGTGESFINNSTDKPMKVKVPKNDLIDAQWFTIPAGQHEFGDSIPGSIGPRSYSYSPFGAPTYVGSAEAAVAQTYECITIGYCCL